MWSRSLKGSIRNQHLYQQLLMKKRSMRWKKYGSIGNEEGERSSWFIGRVMGTNMTNG